MTVSMLSSPLRIAGLVAALFLTGCEIPGVWPDPRIVQREHEAKAVGGACRLAVRGIEDCYTLNPKASKAGIFAGWKEMDLYMRENKIEGIPSVLPPPADSTSTKPTKARTPDTQGA